MRIHRISTLSFRLSSIDKSDNMLHSPSGFPSRISCRIIGCDFSSLDTFTYCLLKAVFHKYHAAEFIMRWRLLGAHEVRFSTSFAELASPPSQTARTPFDVYGFPLIIFADHKLSLSSGSCKSPLESCRLSQSVTASFSVDCWSVLCNIHAAA